MKIELVLVDGIAGGEIERKMIGTAEAENFLACFASQTPITALGQTALIVERFCEGTAAELGRLVLIVRPFN